MSVTLGTFPFHYLQTRFVMNNAYWLARMADLAYRSVSKSNPEPSHVAIMDELGIMGGFTDLAVFNNNSSQAFVARHERFVVASFRGTDEFRDWADNANMFPLRRSLGTVHRGFQLALEDVWPSMLETIKQFQQNPSGMTRPLWLTGHSLGGAMATLAAADLIERDQPFYGLYTFGQPRCGGREFARNYNIEAKDRTFRFQNNNDAVSRVPYRVTGYSHVGTCLYIDTESKLHSDISWWYRFLDTVEGRWEALFEDGTDGLEDHKMSNYIKALDPERGFNSGFRPGQD